MRVLFVCLGNICRSPAAHGVFREMAKQHGLGDTVFIDSAGTGAWHVGNPPDARMTAAAAKRGYDLSDLRARQATSQDFHDFDFILAMDESNLRNLRKLHPAGSRASLRKFLEFGKGDNVPDPYYGGEEGFEHVLDLVEDASRGLIRFIDAKS